MCHTRVPPGQSDSVSGSFAPGGNRPKHADPLPDMAASVAPASRAMRACRSGDAPDAASIAAAIASIPVGPFMRATHGATAEKSPVRIAANIGGSHTDVSGPASIPAANRCTSKALTASGTGAPPTSTPWSGWRAATSPCPA